MHPLSSEWISMTPSYCLYANINCSSLLTFQRSHVREEPYACLPNAQVQVPAGSSALSRAHHWTIMCNSILNVFLGNTQWGTLTVTRTQWRSKGSPPLCFPLPPPSISARRRVLLTLRMLMSFSQQKAWMRVKWICRATSWTSSSSVARMHRTTLSGSLKGEIQDKLWDLLYIHIMSLPIC